MYNADWYPIAAFAKRTTQKDLEVMKKTRISAFLAFSLPLLVCGVSVLSVSAVLAAECPAPPPDQPKERRALAKEWFARAEAAENAGKDVEAVRAYSCSMRMTAHPFTAYNLGRVAERSGDVELALKSFQAYLTLKPDATDKDEIEAKIQELAAKIKEVKELGAGEEAPAAETPPVEETPSVSVAPPEETPVKPVAPEPPPRVTEPAAEPRSSSHVLEWVVGGVSAAALATGIIMNIVARKDMDTCNNKGAPDSSCDSAKTAAYTSYVMFGLAGAAAAVEGVLFYRLWSSGDNSADDTSVSLGWIPGGLSVSARGRF
jgi:hypothetical protein